MMRWLKRPLLRVSSQIHGVYWSSTNRSPGLTLNILTVATLKANHPRYNDTKFFDHFAQDVPLLYCGGVIMLDIFWYKNSYLSKWDVGETDEQRTFYVLERPAYPPGATCSGSFYILHYSLERVA